MSALSEIANWKLEARLEDSDRYFYHHVSFSQLEEGHKSYVVGRKGTGKSAIAQYLARISSPNTFSKTLRFGHFPFNDLYGHTHDSFNAPNQYITLWKYLIYSATAKLFIQNEAINNDLRAKLQQVFGDGDASATLAKQISRWTSANLDFKILATGLGISRTRSFQDNTTSWIDRVDVIETILLENMDDSTYFIIFDELDEDYSSASYTTTSSKYGQLLTSLFKAVHSIRAIFADRGLRLHPVIFLRDDIYYALQDPDKTKWSDLKLDLDWSDSTIKNLLAFRLSRAARADSRAQSFEDAWYTVFSSAKLSYGTRKSRNIELFRYISDQTHLRPRDFIKYLQVCAHEATIDGAIMVSPAIVKRSGKAFSNYLRSELEDEIHAVLPDIKAILDVFSRERKQVLSIQEFSDAYTSAMRSAGKQPGDVEHILRILFHFSVIGNQPRQKTAMFFKYKNPEARLNFSEQIVVHKGLFKAFQVI